MSAQKVSGWEGLAIYVIMAAMSFGLTLLLTFAVKNALIAFIAIAIAIYSGMKLTKTSFKQFVKNYGWAIAISALAALFVTSRIKPVVLAILLMMNVAISFFMRGMKRSGRFSVELVMLITVLASFAYGPTTGAAIGAVAMLMDYAFSMRFSYFMPATITMYALIGFFAANFSSFGITTVGIAATVFYNVFVSIIILAFMGGHPSKSITFGLTDIALNSVLFTAVAPWLLSIIR